MRARPATVLAIVAVLVVALAVVAAIVSSGRDRPTLDATTPEGVVQLYVTALFDDDVAAAAEDYLAPELNCGDFLSEMYLADTFRVAVVETTTTKDTAQVELSIEEDAGLFNGSWSHREIFTLRRDAGTWLITGEPWPVYQCE